MNIVLVTWKGEGNYGTCLQSFSLYEVLQILGHKVFYLPFLPSKYSFSTICKDLLKKTGLLGVVKKILHVSDNKQRIKRRRFQEKYLNEILIYSKQQEEQLVEKTDCFISGSDQIWNTYFQFAPFYFLNFAKEKKRVAYASSIGTNDVKDEYKEDVKQLLLKYNSIGVREKEAVKVLSELTGRNDIQQVLDPTFLLEPEEWERLCLDAEYEIELPTDYLLCYLVGNNPWYKDYLVRVRDLLKIKNVIIIPSVESPDFNCNGSFIYKNASPIEFVDLIRRAKFVCTDSFHATALCVNHSIPFVEFLRFKNEDVNSQNSRLFDLLEHYGLIDRIYTENSDAWLKSIDYSSVQDILNFDRKNSLNYLKQAIG